MATNNAVNTSLSGQTGTGNFVGATTPTLVTPILGVATATSINKVAFTAPATAATLALADGSSLTTAGAFATTFTFTGATSVTFPTSGTLATTGGSGVLVTASIAGTTQAAAVNTRYIVANAGQTTITLPTTFAIGDVVIIKGLGAGGWILQAGAATTIKAGNQTTSAAGSLTSSNLYDTVTVCGIVANTTWSVDSMQSAGLTFA